MVKPKHDDKALESATSQEVIDPIVKEESLYTSEKSINEAIETAGKAANSLILEYQRIACSVCHHVAKHHDIRVARTLLEKLPAGMRKQSMAMFIDRFAPVKVDDDGVFHYDKTRTLDLSGALATPWNKLAREVTYRPFSLEQAIRAAIKQAQQRLIKGVEPEKGDNVTNAQVAALEAMLPKLHDLGVKSDAKEPKADTETTTKAA